MGPVIRLQQCSALKNKNENTGGLKTQWFKNKNQTKRHRYLVLKAMTAPPYWTISGAAELGRAAAFKFK